MLFLSHDTHETSLIYKFENLQIVLKNPNGGHEFALAFQKMGHILSKEGSEYSINRESLIKFFNELTVDQQREFLTLFSAPANQGKTVYDVAQEYKLKLMSSAK